MHNGSLGAWTPSELIETAKANKGIGADSDLPDDARFVAGVAKLIRRCILDSKVDKDANQIAVFLLTIGVPELPDSIHRELKRSPMLSNGQTKLNGRLWFVVPPVNSGQFIEMDADEDDEIIARIEELGLADHPAIIFEPRTSSPQIRFYVDGVNDLEACSTANILEDISLDSICEAIDHIYHRLLKTPEAQNSEGKLWEKSDKNWPVEKAELQIQNYLRTGLTMAFPTCIVREEQTDIPGRLDLEIEQQDFGVQGKFIRHAILELKVLRSFGSTGKSESNNKTLEWIKSGVEQAASYRRKRCALSCALCCFDMRVDDTGNDCFKHVQDQANQLEVRLERWYLYSTSKKYRAATTPC